MAKKKTVKRIQKNQASSSKLKVECQNKEEKLESIELKETKEATNVSTLSIFMNTCRLCEGQDGPFVDIFNAERTLAKKIDEIMPFVIAENDDLPQKVCFRCSAKMEELYEFLQRCVKTQESFDKALGRNGTLKKKYRAKWENKLKQSNVSNDDICNAFIEKAIEKIKNIPNTPVEKCITEDVIQNQVKSNEVITKGYDNKQIANRLSPDLRKHNKLNEICPSEEKSKLVSASESQVITTNTFSLDKDFSNVTSEEVSKPFNIMDHVSKIKVNGVGDLFQCKLCNRNFLIKEVVLNHRCAKNGGKKIAGEEKPIAPVPPKNPVVKYINTKAQNDNKNSKQVTNIAYINTDADNRKDNNIQPQKPKRRIGPASKVRQLVNISSVPAQIPFANQGCISQQMPQVTSMPTVPVVLPIPTNNKFSLVLRPDNSYMLVEERPEQNTDSKPVLNNAVTIGKINNLQSLTVKSVSKLNSPAEIQMASVNHPYPVHLIHSGLANNLLSSPMPNFLTPAIAAQPYSAIQTGYPRVSISTNSQPPEVSVKSLTQMRENSSVSVSAENQFFRESFVNTIDSQKFAVTTRNVIQESQISTSSFKNLVGNQYSCNICGNRYTKESKLLSHIQSHYNQLDEEDKRRDTSKKRKYRL